MSTNYQKSCYSVLSILRKIKSFTRNSYLAITLAKLKLSPVQLGTGWVMNIVFNVPTLLFLCFVFPYCLNLYIYPCILRYVNNKVMLSYVMKRTLEKHKRTRLRSETYRQLLFYLDFRSLVC